MNDDIRRRLQHWGSEPTPEIDHDFATRLEADLRSSAYFAPRRGPEPSRPRRRILRPGIVMAALLVVALALGAVTRITESPASDVLVLGDASGATLTLPGAPAALGSAGAELPDGTLIEIGADGFAVVNGVVLPADSRAVVVDGHLEFLPLDTDSDSTIDTDLAADATSPATRTAVPSTTATRPTADVAAQPDRQTPDTDVIPTERPAATVTPETSPAPDRAPTFTDPVDDPPQDPTLEPTARRTDDSLRTKLERIYRPERALLSWTIDENPLVRKWEVRVRRGDTVHTAAVIRQPHTTTLLVERPARDRVFYTVFAIGVDGKVLSVSNEVRVKASASD